MTGQMAREASITYLIVLQAGFVSSRWLGKHPELTGWSDRRGLDGAF